MSRLATIAALAALCLAACNRASETSASTPAAVAPSRVPEAARERIGSPAPELPPMRWLGEARSNEDLRGHVVLIRFFTNTCPFCRTSAPALAQLHRDYGARGLEVLGIFHPKPPREGTPLEVVQAFVDEFGWEFPVALDDQWTALDRFWPPASRSYTSFSFLIDKRGHIRLIHPGPEFHSSSDPEHEQCDRDFRDLEQSIQALLSES